MNFSRLFRSRWAALWWAGGVIWFAYDIAGEAPTANGGNASEMIDASGETVNASDLAMVANALAP
ncbi:hypothetical protein [Sphingomonas sp. Mn802worker]|uniref:hypothetical protein n=1 Tax=Sphingomonas sp. Mn802worker TaxID=629773 RepID=UPI0003A53CF0|nr:hypothetical protein [Sphingomonas sp. Mn802worker]